MMEVQKKKRYLKNIGEGGGVEGGVWRKGHVYVYGWFMLFYGRNQHNIVKQLSSN